MGKGSWRSITTNYPVAFLEIKMGKLVRIGSGELLQQAMLTASDYMSKAVWELDREFGEGYAKKNPDLVGVFMRVAAADFDTGLRVAAQENLEESLVAVLEQLATAIRGEGLPL